MTSAKFPSKITSKEHAAQTAAALVIESPTLVPSVTCAETSIWFRDHPDIQAIPVVDPDGRVHGLVTRLVFMAAYAKPYAPELYSKKSILKLANLHPLIVDEHTSIAELGSSVLLEHRDALTNCFVVTSQGRYLGLGTAETLMRSKMQMLEAREKELNIALNRAQEANKAKSSFLAMMSHELRTPLNAILGFSEMIQTEVFGSCLPRYRDYASDINGAGKHLLALINDILDLSKAEAGKLDLHCEPTEIEELIMECVRLMREGAAQNQQRLTVTVDHLPFLFVDRLRVKQILLNLISNAVKFTPEGGSIFVTAAQDHTGCVHICVQDTGIGIPPEMLAAVFEPFRQVDTALSRKFEGTGLGLSLVQSLMAVHDGSATIESKLGKGTAVSIHFPASRVAASPSISQDNAVA